MAEALALLGGKPIRPEPYQQYNTIGDEEKKRAMKVLDGGVLSGFVARGNETFLGGPEVRKLEELFTVRFKSRWAVSFNSATSALHACLVAAGVGPGDEVIVPPYTMSATAAAAVMCHAVPVFVDIEADTFCIDTNQVADAITPRTKAIIAVNLFGQPADLAPLMKLAEGRSITVIEDNAQAPGALYKERLTGTIAHMGVFSLNRHKTIQCGEGGITLTNDETFALRLRLCRNHGEVVLPDWGLLEPSDMVGHNYRLSELHAAVAIPQLSKLDDLNHPRQELAQQLSRKIDTVDFLKAPIVRDRCTHVYYLYPLLYDASKTGVSRDTFIAAVNAEGINASRYTIPTYKLPLFTKHRSVADRGFSKIFPLYDRTCPYAAGLCPVTERIEDEQIIVTNICRPPHTDQELNEFVDAVEKIINNIDRLRKWEANS